jgi:hypothetical protein
VLIKSHGYKFGVGDETISSAMGKNQLAGTLTKAGKLFVKMVDLIDKNHFIKSIEENP